VDEVVMTKLADNAIVTQPRADDGTAAPGVSRNRGPILPRLDVARLERHLPEARRVRIEINGCLCGAPVAIPDAVAEFATGWAFAHRFFDSPDQVGRVSATSSHVSLMVQGGVNLDRARYESIGWIPRQDLEAGSATARSARLARAVAVMPELDAIASCQGTFRRFDDDGARVGYIHAGIATADEVKCIARDLHVHAAVHKVLGWVIAGNIDCSSALLAVRGVIDDHIVEAASRAGIPIIATDAVPTTSAIVTAGETCATIIGLALSHRRGVFADGGHLGDDGIPFVDS
jgi:formate dehydrogenase accessory protein FdhD